jgi:hypothetical protein
VDLTALLRRPEAGGAPAAQCDGHFFAFFEASGASRAALAAAGILVQRDSERCSNDSLETSCDFASSL